MLVYDLTALIDMSLFHVEVSRGMSEFNSSSEGQLIATIEKILAPMMLKELDGWKPPCQH